MPPSQTGSRCAAALRAALPIGAVAAMFVGCAMEPAPWEGRGRPDIILVTIDSLRADHLGAYGYSRPTSPALDALAAEGVLVRHHIAQAPYTPRSSAAASRFARASGS